MVDHETEAEQVLTADLTFSDEPLNIDAVDGLREAVKEVAREQPDENVHVRCDDRVCDYDVYWNSKTDSVRVGAVAIQASYEVPMDEVDTDE